MSFEALEHAGGSPVTAPGVSGLNPTTGPAAGGNSVVIVGTAGIVGSTLAGKALATVPVSTYVLGLWMATLPIGFIAKRYGRLATFELGALCGTIAGLLCCLAVINASFVLLCVGTLFGGFYAAVHQSYRFAAADTASDHFKPKAISWVLAGGLFAYAEFGVNSQSFKARRAVETRRSQQAAVWIEGHPYNHSRVSCQGS